MANKKIQELSSETTLTDEHLLITQENSDTAETKSMNLALLKSWLNLVGMKEQNRNTAERFNHYNFTDSEYKAGSYSHSEGYYTKSSGGYSHAEGHGTTASGEYSHSEGYYTEALGSCSHASGKYTKATDECQFVIGKMNTENADAVFIVGYGTSTLTTKNIFEVLKDGSIHFTGKIIADNGISTNTEIALLADNWVGDVAPYTQTVNITDLNITSNVIPVYNLIVSDDVSTGLMEVEQYSYITKKTTATDSITFSCYESKPTVDLNINVKIV